MRGSRFVWSSAGGNPWCEHADYSEEEKMRLHSVVMGLFCFVFVCPGGADIYLSDGKVHSIDYAVNEEVWVDYQAPGVQTEVNWRDGAITPQGIDLRAFADSTVNFAGGWLGDDLWALENSHVTISGGAIDGRLHADGHANVTMYDGRIAQVLYAVGNAEVSIFGGSIGGPGSEFMVFGRSQVTVLGGEINGILRIEGDGILNLQGSDFAVDGQPFGYGELTNLLGGGATNDPLRYLTGTLADGGSIANNFYIGHDARIVLSPVPVPSAVLLGILGLGTASWRLRGHRAS